MKCYDPQGNEHNKESIDARECIQYCGYTLEKKVEIPLSIAFETVEGSEAATPAIKEVKVEVAVASKIRRGRPAGKR